MEVENKILEHIWRNCYQIVAWEKEHIENSFPSINGCGFFLKIDEDYIFVTVDHVIHNDYHSPLDAIGDNNNDSSKEYEYEIICNKDEHNLSSLFFPIYNFISIDCYNFRNYFDGNESIELAMLPDRIDVSYSNIGSIFPNCFYTHDLSLGDNVIVQPGLGKLYMTECIFSEPHKNDKYVVVGALNDVKNEITMNRINVYHDNIVFEGCEDGLYKFKCDRITKEDEWKGLSGSPFFSYEGKLIGMLMSVVFSDNILWVMPIDTIYKYIQRFKNIQLDSMLTKI